MKSIITLTTDFGLSDGYVAAMKGVILSINPEACLVDISHGVSPHNIKQAAFVSSVAAHFFPVGTIHLVVVDPGVGTERKPVILSTGRDFFVAPDNGVLSIVIDDTSNKDSLKSYVISNPRYRLPAVSRTFHGRDIFAPAAAYISLGVPPENFGVPLPGLNTFPVSVPQRGPGGLLTGEVIYIDSFGNLITNIKQTDIQPGKVVLEIEGRMISGLSSSYRDNEGLLAIIGSSGRLEIAFRDGSAANYLSAKTGTKVSVSPGH